MELQYVRNIAGGVANINIFSPIGPGGISGQAFADEIRFLNEVEGVNTINVHINSPGGSVIDGISIFTAIMNSKAVVNTFVEGIAASIAGVIAMAGKRRVINDFGRLMLHLPNINGDEDGTTPEEKEMLTNFKDMIVKTFVNNTFKSTEDIEAIMTRETWFNADESLKEGFVDHVKSTSRQLTMVSNNALEVYACAKEILDKPIIKNKMEKVKNFLSLDEAVNETVVLKAVKNISKELETTKTDLEAVKNENETLKTRVTELQDAEKAQNDILATEFVENSIKEGKFDETKKEELLVSAKNDLAGFKALTLAISTSHADVRNTIADGKTEKPVSDKSLRELEKTDATKLEDIRNNNPALYAEMYKKQYGVELPTA
ncbi:MAG: Clp protease ClpP [Nitrosomonadaceae bacterium]